MYKCVRVWFLTVSAKMLPTCSGCSNALKYYSILWPKLDVLWVIGKTYCWTFMQETALERSDSESRVQCYIRVQNRAPPVVQIFMHIHQNILNSTLNQSLLSYRQWRETNSADPILSFINPSASCRI